MLNVIKPAISGLSSVTRILAKGANIAGTLVVLALVGVVNFDVIARGAFNAPFLGAVEVVQFSMILIVFFFFFYVVRVNRLTRSDGFLVFLNDRAPRLTLVLTRLIEIVSSVFMTLIAIAIWPEFTEMWQTRDYFGVPGVFTAPWWPIKLVIFLSAALCALIFVLKVLSPAHKPELIRAPEFEDTP